MLGQRVRNVAVGPNHAEAQLTWPGFFAFRIQRSGAQAHAPLHAVDLLSGLVLSSFVEVFWTRLFAREAAQRSNYQNGYQCGYPIYCVHYPLLFKTLFGGLAGHGNIPAPSVGWDGAQAFFHEIAHQVAGAAFCLQCRSIHGPAVAEICWKIKQRATTGQGPARPRNIDRLPIIIG